MRLGGVGGINPDHSHNQNSDGTYHDPNDWQNLRKVQMTVATSTFSVIAFIGLFCSCIYLGCCRPKRHTRIHGRAWSTHPTFAVAALPGGPMMMHHHHLSLDPSGLHHLNPYLINPHYYADSNFNTTSGLYHHYPNGDGGHLHNDEKPPMDNTTPTGNAGQEATADTLSGPTYRPFFAKMDWQPPEPPSYSSLGITNPVYNPGFEKTEPTIEEKVPVGSLATSDPTKGIVTEHHVKSDAGGEATKELQGAKEEEAKAIDLDPTAKEQEAASSAAVGAAGSTSSMSAPPESLLSLESKDGGHPYPDGVTKQKKKGQWEEFQPPPYNPSYMSFQRDSLN